MTGFVVVATHQDDAHTWIELKPIEPVKASQGTTQSDAAGDVLKTLELRFYTSTLGNRSANLTDRLHTLTGFDNTGNIRLWPSEALLAHCLLCPQWHVGFWGLLNKLDLTIHHVCEIAAGMTGAAGLAAAATQPRLFNDVRQVILTDGNERCVASLVANAARSMQRFGPKIEVTGSQLTWSNDPSVQSSDPPDRLRHTFHMVLAADCFFNTNGHRGLLTLIDRLLPIQQPAVFVAIAPLRSTTLHQFVALVEEDGKWLISCLHPREYMQPVLLEHLILDCSLDDQLDTAWDKWIGHLILLRRRDFG